MYIQATSLTFFRQTPKQNLNCRDRNIKPDRQHAVWRYGG